VKQDALGESLRVHWAWGTGADWSAADHPRLTYAGATHLDMLYVVQPLAGPDAPGDELKASDLIELLVPEPQRCLRVDH
jgi:hypothetical protein